MLNRRARQDNLDVAWSNPVNLVNPVYSVFDFDPVQ
jgi:hypothetical protein